MRIGGGGGYTLSGPWFPIEMFNDDIYIGFLHLFSIGPLLWDIPPPPRIVPLIATHFTHYTYCTQ
jgi:hypothetical protein